MFSNEIYFQALQSSRDGLVITEQQNGKQVVIYVNPAFESITGYTLEECLHKNCNFLQSTDTQQPEIDQIRQAIKNNQSILVTLRNYRKDGSRFWNELSISPITNNQGGVTHFIGIQKDVTEQVSLKQQLKQKNRELQAANQSLKKDNKIDFLTQLYNRKVVEDEAQTLVSLASRKQQTLSFFFIDLDNFKDVNDLHSHEVGDRCLIHVAMHLRQLFKRKQDLIIRYGGEEFLILSYGLSEQETQTAADKILHNIQNDPIKLDETGQEALSLTVSIGVVRTSPNKGFDTQQSILMADLAMYQAKKQGKNRVIFDNQSNC